MKPLEVLIAIPARGGSKRLHRKNLIAIKGIPMIAYTIRAAIESKITNDVFVCTEDDEIATIAINYGAKVHRIPRELADDEVSSTTPCLDLLDDLEIKGRKYEFIFNLQPTSPLRNYKDIKNSLDILLAKKADFLVSTTPIDPHYFHWAMQETNGSWEMYFKKKYLVERTFLPTIYRPNGAIKLGKVEALKQNKNFFGSSLTTYEMPEERSIHVATAFDVACVNGILEQ